MVKRLRYLVLLSALASCSNEGERDVAPHTDAAGVIFILGKANGMSDETFEVLKEACGSAINSMEPGAYSGLVGYGFGASKVIPLGMTHSASDVKAKLSEFQMGNGASLELALSDAHRMFALQESSVPFEKKLVILLSAGFPGSGDHKKALNKLVGAGATVSTVAVSIKGLAWDAWTFSEIAKVGKGYSYATSRAKDCSRILIQETRRVLGP